MWLRMRQLFLLLAHMILSKVLMTSSKSGGRSGILKKRLVEPAVEQIEVLNSTKLELYGAHTQCTLQRSYVHGSANTRVHICGDHGPHPTAVN